MKTILLTQREQTDRYGEQIDVLEASYVRYFQELGYVPVAVSNFSKEPGRLVEKLRPAAIVLTGGGSLPAKYYDQDYGYEEQKERDRLELCLTEKALKERIPLLGICRGMQFINGYLGGKTSKLAFPEGVRPNGKDHPVICEGEELLVNNYHNDGIYGRNLAEGLVSIAEDSAYGVVEGYRSETEGILGIQWHPERKFMDEGSRERTKELIRQFLSKERN